jgi:hypothetical protein
VNGGKDARLPQEFSLNCCGTPPSRRKHGALLRQIRLFGVFAAVVKPSFPRTVGKPFAPLPDFTGIHFRTKAVTKIKENSGQVIYRKSFRHERENHAFCIDYKLKTID